MAVHASAAINRFPIRWTQLTETGADYSTGRTVRRYSHKSQWSTSGRLFPFAYHVAPILE